MKAKKNLIQLTENLNKVRQENAEKTFLRTEIENIVGKAGISRAYFGELAKSGVFPTERIGQNVLYTFPKGPIYKGQVEKAYEAVRARGRKPEETKKVFLDEENAISLLKKLGYRIYKCEGIDIKKLQAEKPDVFEAYKLEVEI